ncbi:MAG: hypothetical protein D6767_11130 [Candidatus Hydrogenedentota bacterium]|nr:MAG: hypothetical protein D6767_11130 [Candidatus Hydrogenedentota bacterium]
MFLCLFGFVTLHAAESTFDIKAGASKAKAPDKWGFDAALSYNYGVDRFLALGLEPQFQWLNYDAVVGTTTDLNTGVTTNVVKKINVYSLPYLLSLRLRFPNESMIEPHLVVGAGYGWTWSVGDTTTQYSGLAWQVVGGAAIALGGGGEWGSTSSIKILLEVGYRGYKPSKDSVEIDMSGLMTRVGIRFSFGGGGSNW